MIAVALALARFVRQAARPRDEVLGKVDGLPGFHSIERHGTAAKTFPGLVLFRFNGPLTFFNADYFKQRALAAADAAGKDVRWFVIDAIPISDIDVNGRYALRDLNVELKARGITLILAGRRTEFLIWLREVGLYQTDWDNRLFPTLNQALKAYRRETIRAELPPS
jgi:MFS superfamily sulfate permease-like transporter